MEEKRKQKLHPVVECLIITFIILTGTLLSSYAYSQIISEKNYPEIDTATTIFGIINEFAIPLIAAFICIKLIERNKVGVLKILIITLFVSIFTSYINSVTTIYIGRTYGVEGLYNYSKIHLFIFPVIRAVLITLFIYIFSIPKVDAFIYDKKIYCGIFKHVFLLFFTLGIWRLVWIYRTTKYLNCVETEDNRNPTTKLLLCMFVPFYSIYWFYKSAIRVDKLARTVNVTSDLSVVCLILELFLPIIPPILMQDKINKILETEPNTL